MPRIIRKIKIRNSYSWTCWISIPISTFSYIIYFVGMEIVYRSKIRDLLKKEFHNILYSLNYSRPKCFFYIFIYVMAWNN